MTLEEALALDPDMLFGILTVRIARRDIYGARQAELSHNFDIATNFDWMVFLDRIRNYGRGFHGPKALDEQIAPDLTNPELCEQALKLGYVEEAMRASAALRQLGLYE